MSRSDATCRSRWIAAASRGRKRETDGARKTICTGSDERRCPLCWVIFVAGLLRIAPNASNWPDVRVGATGDASVLCASMGRAPIDSPEMTSSHAKNVHSARLQIRQVKSRVTESGYVGREAVVYRHQYPMRRPAVTAVSQHAREIPPIRAS